MTFLSNIWLNSNTQICMREQKASSIFGEEWKSGICNGARWGDRSSRGAAIFRRRRTWGDRTDVTRSKLTAAKEIKTYYRWSYRRRRCREWIEFFFSNVQDSQTSFQIIWFITAHNRFEKRIEQKRTKRKMVKGVMGEKSKLKFFLGQLRI